MKRIITIVLLFSVALTFAHSAQIPAGYYDDANNKTGYQLKTALKTIITNGHNDQGYDNLYTLYETADTDNYYENDNTVLDMYSEKPSATDSYNYTHNNNTCGNYSNEGDCYNREHLMPQSVFNSASPMKSDGHFVVPSDGYVNNRRSNYAFGEVTNPTWTSTNGSKLGPNTTAGYSDTVFEPIDEFKGDIARMLFYFATRYEDNVASWSHDMLNGTSDQVYADWFLEMLLQWDSNDPVSQREIDRNEAVYNYQGNRNPFIDHPEWVNDVWGSALANPSITNITITPSTVTPSDNVSISADVTDADGISNVELHWGTSSGNLNTTIQMSNSSGDTYVTDTAIPAQTDGTTIYYEVYAVDTNSDSQTSSEQNYLVSALSSTCIDEDFTDSSDWTNHGTGDDNVSSHYGSASHCRAFSSNDYMISPSVDNPNTLEFHQDSSNGGNGKTATIEYSINGGSWTQFYSFSVNKNGADESIDLTSLSGVDLSNETNVTFKFNSSFNTWYLDDVKVYCGAVSSNDTDAYAGSGTQPTGIAISSTKDTSIEAVNVFIIDIYDQGTSDGLPTEVTNIHIKPNTTNTADWTDNIQGFTITDSDGATVNPTSTTITDTYVDFTFNTGDLSVPNNNLIELTFAVYLNTSNIEDGKILSFMVDVDNHEFTADSNNTGFTTTFPGSDFNSNDFTIDVTFDEIRFSQQPSNVEVNAVMSPAVVVIATDENGNIDKDFNGTGASIGLTSTGSFDGTATTEVDAVQGVATFNNLIFDTDAIGVTLTTTDPDGWGWTNITSNTFDITAIATNCASESFNNAGNNNNYTTIHWTGDNNINWTATDARADQDLNGDEAVMLRNGSLTNDSSFSNGCGTVEFDYARIYSGNSILKVFVNSVQYGGDITVSSTSATHFSVDVNVSGDIDIELRNSSKRTLISNLQWSCFGSCTAPTTDAVFASNSPQNITGIGADLSWTNGSGNKRIIVIRDGSDVTFTPADNTTYTANSTFGSGTDISGNGEYVIYNDNGTTMSVTGLSAGHTYYVKIFEYNCSAGSEMYYTTGTPASDFFVTVPNNPNDFTVGCITNTTIDLSWTTPSTSEFDGYLLVVREGSSSPHSVASTNPLTINGADTNYPNAEEFGSTNPKSRYLYVGTNTNTTITGLTEGTQYTFKIYTYSIESNDYQYSSGTQTTQTADLNDVNTAHASPRNTQAFVQWINPDACYDEILVVTNETSGIDFTPSGDGSAYTANASYSSVNQVVYKGTDNNLTVTSLTNGTRYYFEIFVRKGTEWSNGIEVSTIPMQGTEFQPGQLIFVGYDGQINGNGADDEYLIATLIDIVPGTTFMLVNSRYEAGATANVRTDKWGGAGDDASKNPGVAEITYNGANSIPAGSVLRLRTDYSLTFLTYAGIITGTTDTDHTSDFSVSIVYGTTSIPNISASGSDQMFLIQGAFVFDGTDNTNEANYTLNGTLLHGITNRVGWVDLTDACNGDSSGGNSRESRLHPSLNCFNVENTNNNAISGFYQNDELHNGSFRDIILAISNATNWTLGTNRYNLDPSTTNEADAGHTFTISGGHNPGTWVSTSNTNWFNCSNWETLSVPEPTTDVFIDANSTVDAVINSTAQYADLFNGVAECNNLTISNLNLKIEGNHTLNIHGNLDIQSGGILDADDGDNSTSDGQIHIYGNWTNIDNTNFAEGNSTVTFEGQNTQTISVANGNQTEEFYNLTINNASGVNFESGNIHAVSDLNILLDTPINIANGHYLLAGNNLTNNTNIVIENQGSLVQTDDTGSITGTGTFQLNKISLPLNNYWEYVYWSSPINSNTLNLGDIVPNAWRYYKYDPNEANNGHLYPGWVMLSANDIPEKGIGYAISAPTGAATNAILNPQFISGNNPFNNGIISVPIIKRAGDDGDMNLLGNPYPSAIDFNAFANDNTDIDASYSLWTNCAGLNGNAHQDSGYTTYVVSGTNTAACSSSGGTAQASQYIATGQGFTVLTKTTASVGDNFTAEFKNAYRVTNHNDNFLNRNTQNDIVWIDMTENNQFNQIAIGFYQGATDAFDRNFDASSMNTGNGFALYSLVGNNKLVIQGLPKLNGTDKTVPLGVESDIARTITLHINHTQGLGSEYIYIRDLYLDVIHNLKTTDYTTTVDAGIINDRFELIFSQRAMNIDDVMLDPNAVLLTENAGVFTVQSMNNMNITDITVYDITGKMLYSNQNIEEQNYQVDLQNVATGNMLIFRVQLNSEKMIIKKMIKH